MLCPTDYVSCAVNKPVQLVVIILGFELACYAGPSELANDVRTGTAPFMAREVLDGFKEKYKHNLPHDLESIFYVLIWHATGYCIPKQLRIADPLRGWRKGSYSNMRAAKDDFINSSGDIMAFIEDKKLRLFIRQLNAEYLIRKGEIDASEGAARTAEGKEKVAVRQAIQERAERENLSSDEYFALLEQEFDRVESEARLHRPTNAISFKRWMRGVGKTIDERHKGCDCCERD